MPAPTISLPTTGTDPKVATKAALEATVNEALSSTWDEIQTKAPLASPAFTGTVTGVTKAMVGLGNVDNTSDINKPVSTAQQTAIDLVTDELKNGLASGSSNAAGRPGDFPDAFAGQTTGLWDALAAVAGTVVTDSDMGQCIEIAGSGIVAGRRATPILPGRIYQARWVFKRTVNSTDPLGDAIAMGLQCLDGTQAAISANVVARNAFVSEGVIIADSVTCSLEDSGVDVTLPAGTKYVRHYLQTYGASPTTRVGWVVFEDITESATSDDVAAAEAASTAAIAAAAQAAASEDAASASAANADASADAALISQMTALAAANAAGPTVVYATKALADAGLAGLAANAVIEVSIDESRSSRRSRYRKTSGVYVFELDLTGRRVVFVDSRSGSDSNDGLSHATAKATVAAAAAMLSNGDTLRLRRGSVFREWPDLSALNGCIIEAYGAGKRPIISARDVVSSFTVVGGGPSYTFTIDLTLGTINRSYPGVFEDGVRLIEILVGDVGVADAAAARAAVAATPGTFYFDGPGSYAAGWAAGTKTYYIHATGSGNPASNGRVYEAYKRERAAWLGGNEWRDVVFHGGSHHDGLNVGPTTGGAQPFLLRCAHIGFARHGSLFVAATFHNMEVIAGNPRYNGGQYHCNPSTLADPSIIRGTRVIGDPRAVDAPIGFYSHGDINEATVEKEGWIIEDAYIENVGLMSGHNDTRFVYFTRLKARNFNSITNGLPAKMRFDDCDIRGGYFVQTGTIRMLQIRAGCEMQINRSFIDVGHRHLWTQTSGQTGGTLMVRDSTIICRATPANGSTPAFFRIESGTMEGLSLTRATLFMANDGAGYLAQATAITSLAVDDLHLIGLTAVSGGAPQRDPILRINSVDTPLSTLLPNARVIWSDPARVIASDSELGFNLRRGTYRPGMKIFSGAAYSMSGSQQPRGYILVGDQILRTNSERPISWVEVAAPVGHQNAVAFCNAGSRSFVSVGNGGSVYSSDLNGTNWAQRTSGTTDILRGVAAWTTGVVVAVGDGGRIIRSTDSGTTWSTVTSGTAVRLRAIATDGTTWVAVGDAGTVGTSTDAGVTWSWGTQGSADHYAMFWHPGLSLFFMGSNAGAIRTSPATISWTSRTTNTEQRVVTFAAGPDGVVAGLYQTEPHFGPSLLTSVDGTAWAAGRTTFPFDIRAIAGPGTSIFNDRGFIAVGESEFIGHGRTIADEWAIRSPVFDFPPSPVTSMADAVASVA